MDLKNYLKSRRERIDGYLEEYLSPGDIPEKLLEAMRYSVFAGGKRVRPVLCIAAYEACGGTGDQVLALGAALEMIHTYSLIHDDLPAMDNDDFRRGRPTNHRVFGDAMAILAGDALLTQAFDLLSDPVKLNGVDPERKNRIISEVSRGAGSCGMVGGQVLDIISEGKKIDFDQLKNLHRRKTGALIRASVVSGALLAVGPEDQVAALDLYGSCMGLAFQVVDDILDVTQTAEELGKSTSDVERGKNTYPSIYGLEESKRLADELLQEALDAIRPFGERADALKAIAEYIVTRKN